MRILTDRRSPNRSGALKDYRFIVLHHTATTDFDSTVRYLCNPAAKASANYVVGKLGQVAEQAGTGPVAGGLVAPAGVSRQDSGDRVAGLGREYLTGLVRLENRLLILLDIDKILGQEESASLAGITSGV